MIGTHHKHFQLALLTIFVTFLGEASALSPSQVQESTRVVLLSDPAHHNVKLRRKLADFLRDLKNNTSEFNCLFLEWGKDSNPAIAAYLKGASYESSMSIDLNRIEKIITRLPYNLVPEFLLQSAQMNGFNVFAVDDDWSIISNNKGINDNEYARLVHEILEPRNEHAAQQADSRFRNGQCKKAVMIFGRWHTDSKSDGVPARTIQFYLQELGYPTQVLNLED